MSVATINWNGVAGSTPDANSCMITYGVGDTLYDTVNAQTFPAGAVSTALDTFLTNHGWSRVTATIGTISTTAGMYAYKAANLNDANGVGSYKYMLLDFRTSGKIYCKVYQSIGTDSALTNIVYQSDVAHGTVSAHTSGSTTYAGKLWIGASARHFVMQSYCNGVYGNQAAQAYYMSADQGFIGCFEISRSSIKNTSNRLPMYGFFASGGINAAGGGIFSFGMPVQSDGSTGANAVQGLSATYYGSCGGTVGSGGPSPVNRMVFNIGFPVYQALVSSLIVGDRSSFILGVAINLFQVSSYFGNMIGDDIQIPVSSDSNFGNEKFHDFSGTFTPYWLIGGVTVRFAVPK